jgi:hypothetical protein
MNVGSTGWAEFCIDDDPDLGDIQFAIDCNSGICRLMNLEPERPVYVNGHSVVEQSLVDGDIITAGESRFGVYWDHGGSQIRKLGVRLAGTAGEATPTQDLHNGPEETRQVYSATRYPSGLVVFGGTQSVCPASEIAGSIAAEYTLYLLVDEVVVSQMENRRVAELVAASPEVTFAADSSGLRRVLVGPNQTSDRSSVLQELWGRNAVAALFCACETAYVLRGISQCPLLAGTSAAQLPARLMAAEPNELRSTFSKVRAILVETEQGNAWSTMVFPRAVTEWQELGLSLAPSQECVVTESSDETA